MGLKNIFISISALLIPLQIAAQNTGTVRGTIKDKNTQEPLTGVTILIEGIQLGTQSDLDGNFKIEKVPVGSYNIQANYVGYQVQKKFNINVTSGNAQILSFELSEDNKQLEEIEVTVNRQKQASVADVLTPNSTQSLSTEEIRANPGGNFDISKVIQALPGVGGAASGGVRNDIIIRGGAPNENVFYLDGVEIPVINHFSTQGSSGGPQGILNVSFIEDVKLSSSAFNAKYDNALASTFEFKQREGNPDRFSGNIRLSGTEFATTLEGPAGKKTNYLISARRSYLEVLFKALDLPIRPNYWDFQYKVTHKIDKKTTLKFIGVGAIDEFSLGQTSKASTESEYIRRSTPLINQWNYTFGVVLNRLLPNGYMNLVASRNMFNNNLDQFQDAQIGNEAFRTLKLRSQEIENKLRLDINKNYGKWKLSFGAMGQYVKFNNDLFQKLTNDISDNANTLIQPGVVINYNSAIEFVKYGAFGQVSRSFLSNRLGASFGLRTDMNSFTNRGNQPLDNISPRVSLSYFLSDKWKISASWGSYTKIPIYTLLGYRDASNELINKDIKYIRSTHYVAGLEFVPQEDLRFTVEGFYKDYANVPVSVRNGISLANQGSEFGAIGNEKVADNGKGQAYGFEVYVQKKLTKRVFGVLSYTFVRSLFSGSDGNLIASAWDSRHLISGILGVKLNKGWELGAKYRFSGGNPYTPFDLAASQRDYLVTGRGVLDYNNVNSSRLINFNQFDIRVDKKWNFPRWTFDLFLDVQNLFQFATPSVPNYTFKRLDDNSGFATTDNQPVKLDGSNAIPTVLQTNSPFFVPSIGFIAEF